MPLKHATETFLVALLGVMILCAAFVAAFLPPVRATIVPWGITFAVVILYPIVFQPLLKSRRADNAFRLLHLVPMAILIVTLAFELLVPVVPQLARAEMLYRWGWTLPAVILSYVLLILFCIEVLRQRKLRVALLLLFFVPFAVLAVSAEQFDLNPKIAAILRKPGQFAVIRRRIAQLPEVVGRDAEEEWKAEQRRMERRGERLEEEETVDLRAEGMKDEKRRPLVSSAAPASSRKFDEKPPVIAQKKPPVPALPPSGFGSEIALPVILAGYTGLLHMRARKRMK